MNINEMSDQEKSVTLARLCGWDVWRLADNGNHNHIVVEDSSGKQIGEFFIEEMCPDFYSLTNMALAWRVLNWASEKNSIYPKFMGWWFRQDSDLDMLGGYLFDMSPIDAQRAWLDKVLSLAIEANLIEKEPA